MSETTTTTNESKPKTPKIRPNSRMAVIVETFKSGITDIEGLALKLQEAEESGKITGLKKTTDDFKSKKDLNFYKKLVNWYLNQAKHKQLVDAPIVPRKVKAKKEAAAQAEVVAQAETQASSEVAAAAPEVDGIPTL